MIIFPTVDPANAAQNLFPPFFVENNLSIEPLNHIQVSKILDEKEEESTALVSGLERCVLP